MKAVRIDPLVCPVAVPCTSCMVCTSWLRATVLISKHLDLLPAQVVQLHMAVEVEAGGVAEQVRKVHDPLVDLNHLRLRRWLLLLRAASTAVRQMSDACTVSDPQRYRHPNKLDQQPGARPIRHVHTRFTPVQAAQQT